MDWNDLKIFLGVVRGGNVRAAAKSLNTSHSTVARRIAAFELAVGAKLFERLPGGLQLTEPGQDLVRLAESVESEILAVSRRVTGRDQALSGRIRLTLPDVFATHLLMPDLVAFNRLYPDIDLEIVSTWSVLDLDRREADIAIRMSKTPPEHLIGRRFAAIASAPYASKAFLETHDLESGEGVYWIGFGARERFPKWIKASAFPHLPERGTIQSQLIQLEASKSGLGIAMLPCFLADQEPMMTRLAEPKVNMDHQIWLLVHPDNKTNTRIKILAEHLGKAFARLAPRISGSNHYL